MNIKGHTSIELTDVNTGEKQKFEDDNMVTNAINLFYKAGGMTNPSAFNDLLKTDAVENLLGGILCLDDTITESANIVHVPTGVNMIANGSVGILNSGNPPELGSYNESESGWQQDGSYKLVFDYTTSQGNGVIKSVCMTSKYEGLKGIGNASNTSRSASAPQTQATYNTINNMAFGGKGSAELIGVYNNKVSTISAYDNTNHKVTVSEYALPVTSLDLRDKAEARLVTTREISLPSPLNSLNFEFNGNITSVTGNKYRLIDRVVDGQYAYLLYVYLGQTQVGYNVYTSYFISDNYPVYLVKYDMVNHTFTVEETLTASVVGFSNENAQHGMQSIALAKNYILWEEHVITIANTSDVNDINNFDDYKFNKTFLKVDDDHVQCEKMLVDLANATAKPVNSGITYTKLGEINGSMHYGWTYGYQAPYGSDAIIVYVWRNPSYIATINNLENAVEKTGDKTMKVTYILTFTD